MLCTLIGAIILSINIQLCLNMYPYDDIGDAGSTSSCEMKGGELKLHEVTVFFMIEMRHHDYVSFC